MSVGHWSAGDSATVLRRPAITPTTRRSATTSRPVPADQGGRHRRHRNPPERVRGHAQRRHRSRAHRARADGYLAELGMTITACNINTWTNPKFRLGARAIPTRPAQGRPRRGVEGRGDLPADGHPRAQRVAGVRRRRLSLPDRLQAVDRVVHRGADHRHMACLEHGIKLAIEPKPYEPRELYMIIPPRLGHPRGAARQQGLRGHNCGLTIDYGHQKMEAPPPPPRATSRLCGVAVHKFDINDARRAATTRT